MVFLHNLQNIPLCAVRCNERLRIEMTVRILGKKSNLGTDVNNKLSESFIMFCH